MSNLPKGSSRKIKPMAVVAADISLLIRDQTTAVSKEGSDSTSQAVVDDTTKESQTQTPQYSIKPVHYRPYMLTGCHVRLPSSSFATISSITANSTDTSNNVYSVAKAQLDQFLRSLHSSQKDEGNFFFSTCNEDNCLWFGKRIDATGYCELDVAIYQDYPSFTSDIIIEMNHHQGEYNLFADLFQQLKDWTLSFQGILPTKEVVRRHTPMSPPIPQGCQWHESGFSNESIVNGAKAILTNITQSQSSTMKILNLVKIPLLVKYADTLQSNGVVETMMFALHNVLKEAVSENNPLLCEFVVIAISALCLESTGSFLENVIVDEIATELITFLLQRSSKAEKYYYQVVQTVRRCLSILLQLCGDSVVCKILNAPCVMVGNEQPGRSNLQQIKALHGGVDVRIDDLLQKINEQLSAFVY